MRLAYLKIAEHRYIEHFATNRVGYSLEALRYSLAGKNAPRLPPFDKWVGGFYRNPYSQASNRKANAPYSELMAADVTLAFNLHIFSQRSLVALRPNLLKDSGAFPRRDV